MSTTDSPTLTHDMAAQDERDAVSSALWRYANRRRADHQALTLARATAVVMATSYTELDEKGDPVVIAQGLYSTVDVLDWLVRANDMGACEPRIGREMVVQLYRSELIPNAVFRQEVERRIEAQTANTKTLAKASGFVLSDGRGDARTFERVLGMVTTPSRGDYPPSLRLFITNKQASAIATALEMDPHDCGI